MRNSINFIGAGLLVLALSGCAALQNIGHDVQNILAHNSTSVHDALIGVKAVEDEWVVICITGPNPPALCANNKATAKQVSAALKLGSHTIYDDLTGNTAALEADLTALGDEVLQLNGLAVGAAQAANRKITVEQVIEIGEAVLAIARDVFETLTGFDDQALLAGIDTDDAQIQAW